MVKKPNLAKLGNDLETRQNPSNPLVCAAGWLDTVSRRQRKRYYILCKQIWQRGRGLLRGLGELWETIDAAKVFATSSAR